jgi:biopolymer transport protein ExbD
MVINVTKDGKILLKDGEVTLEQLPARLTDLRSRQPSLSFIMKADQGVPLGLFVKVLDASKDAGIENLGLSTDPSQPAP